MTGNEWPKRKGNKTEIREQMRERIKEEKCDKAEKSG